MFGFRHKLAGATLTIALSLSAMVPSAQAASLRIGLAADVSSLDPHYLNIAPNVGMSAHFFDALVNIDANGQLIPGLATAWRAVDATTWEFTLRRGVKFHDGSEFTAEDVIFSLDRPATLTRSPGPFTAYTKQIVAKQIVDPYTVRLKTATPYGPMALDVSAIYIVSKKAAQQATTADFNSGKALIGTGPYKLARFRRGDRIEVMRNDDYWGAKSDWDKVTFRIIASSASRLAALLSGDVDAIEAVPTADLSRLRRSDKFRFAQKISWRTIFWHVDQRAAPSPYVTDLAGKPLATNPLQDVRVRKAISLAINRKALVERTMEGLAVPASNIVAPGLVGYNAALPVDTYDPEAARKLLAEAGYPDGFAMTIHGPNDRYINDEQVVQTMAQFLNRIGIRTRVETLPLSVYFARARKGEFSMALLGWGTLAGDFGLRTLVGTPNPAIGWGTWNWGKYSNPEVDKLIAASLGSVDQGKRNGFAQQAMAMALTQYAVVPLHHQYATWGMRQGLTYTARTDEFTFAHQFRAAKEGE